MSIASRIEQYLSQYAPTGEEHSSLPRGSVRFEKVSKRFRAHRSKKASYSTLKSNLLRYLRQNPQPQLQDDPPMYFDALKEVSVHVEPGQSLGVIGRNGSGKSSTLKLIAGIYQSDAGGVEVSGTVSALIELGAGFHPDFSGRENVFLGGIMYGLTTAEIESRFDSIVRYAELAHCIDDPVRTYSSGMYMRLGFSLAVHTDPDILLIDEVLAVGDAAFINRCHDTISDFKRRGKTLIFVTHDLSAVTRWCDEVLWLEKGKVRERGEPRQVIDSYLQFIERLEEQELDRRNEEPIAYDETDMRSKGIGRWGDRKVSIDSVRMYDGKREEKWVFHDDDSVIVEVDYTIHTKVDDLVCGVGILRVDGLEIHGTNSEMAQGTTGPDLQNISEYPYQARYRYVIDRLNLTENSYYLDVAVHRSDGYAYDYHHRQYKFSVRTKRVVSGVMSPMTRWEFSADDTDAFQSRLQVNESLSSK